MKVVGVVFTTGTSSTVYSFSTDIDNLGIGDYVVVDTANGIALAKIATFEPAYDKITKMVICKVDLTAHNARLAKAKGLETIKKKMDDRRKKLEEVEIYELLATKDSTMKDLLDDYNNLLKG
jgi:hypothetical protein